MIDTGDDQEFPPSRDLTIFKEQVAPPEEESAIISLELVVIKLVGVIPHEEVPEEIAEVFVFHPELACEGAEMRKTEETVTIRIARALNFLGKFFETMF